MSVWDSGQTLLASIVKDPEFEKQHPRGRDGRFITKGGYVKFMNLAASMWQRAKVEDFTDDGKVKISYTGADGKPVEEVMKKSWLYHADPPKATLNPGGWKKVGGQAGSNPGGFFEDKDGQKWYVKNPQSKLHVGNENLMNRLYGKAGAPTPQTAVSPDGKRFLTKIEESVAWNAITGDRLELVKKIAAKNFVIDAWLANWDAPLNDNIRVTPDNVVLRVDAGGGGMFRARGDRRLLTSDVKELQSMRDAGLTGRTGGAALYEHVTHDDEINAAKRILAILPDEISKMVSEEGLPNSLAQELITRRAWLATHYSLTLPESTLEGQALLKTIAETKSAQTKAEAEAAVKALIKIAPDKAVTLAPGAPVWVKQKTGGIVTPSDAKVPDLMIVHGEINFSQDDWYQLKSKDGKIEYTVRKSDAGTAFEVLRENNASENAKYASGEKPQIGDKVDQGKAGSGVVTEMFPLYMRVMGEDGKSRVSRIANSKLLAKVGEHDTTSAILQGPGALANIGTLADLDNSDAKFPMVVFSLPHRVNVLVTEYDSETKKAKITLSSGQVATVPASKLYDDSTVDRDTVNALPVRVPGVRAPRTPVKLDVNALPEKEFKFNRNVTIEIKPGDRVLKSKNRSELNFVVIRKDGTVEYGGSNKSHTDSEGVVFKDTKYSVGYIKAALSGSDLTDVTPAKYAEAAHELGHDDELKFTPRRVAMTRSYANVDKLKAKFKSKGQITYQDIRYDYDNSLTDEFHLELTPEAGDHLFGFTDVNSPRVGIKKTGYVNLTSQTEFDDYLKDSDNWVSAPRMILRRNGVRYDLGYNGVNADDPSKWVPFSEADYDAIQGLKNEYWWSSSPKPEPTATLSDGSVVKYSGTDPNLPFSNFNVEANNLTILTGKRDMSATGHVGIGSFNGKSSLMRYLQKSVAGWDKGNPDAVAAGAPVAAYSVRKQLTAAELAQLPIGVKLIAHMAFGGDEVVTKTDDVAAPWLRVDKNIKGSDDWLANLEVTSPYAKRSEVSLDAMTTGTRLKLAGHGHRVDWHYTKQADGKWLWQEKNEQVTSNDIADGFLLEVESAPAQGGQAAKLIDFTETPGYKALNHKIEVSREQLNSGALDDRIHEIMTMKINPVGSGYRDVTFKLEDGTVHGDPYMAQFAKDFDGDQQVLNAPAPLFNAIKKMTGLPSMHRGVTTADQRDAIKVGDHFTGTGAYGNGTYTAVAKSVTGSYGGAKVELTPKPNALGIQNDDMYRGQAEDMADAVLDRVDALAAISDLPNRQQIETTNLLDDSSLTPSQIAARDRLMTVWNTTYPNENATSKKKFLDRAAVKAAVLYTDVFERKGMTVSMSTTGSRYYHSYDSAEKSVTLTVANPSADGKGGSIVDFSFEDPWSSQKTSYARAAGDKMDKNRSFFVKTTYTSNPSGGTYYDPERIRQMYDNGWWIDHFADHLEHSGIGAAIADNQSEWQEAQDKLKKLDSRISFISEPGRWTLAAGYDFFYVPGQEFYIFTHRAGFIVKK